jgi:hypothetical protein
MLTEEEKIKIKAEEIYRREVQKDLEKPVTNWQRFLVFFNTPFGIYLLSTLLVGVISFSYTYWRENHDKELASQAKRRLLNSELRFRIEQMNSALANAEISLLRLERSLADTVRHNQRKRIYDFGMDAEALGAVVRLGGIAEVPGEVQSDEMVDFYGALEMKANKLPARYGYKSKEFAFVNLEDLVVQIWELDQHLGTVPTFELLIFRDKINGLRNPTYDLLDYLTQTFKGFDLEDDTRRYDMKQIIAQKAPRLRQIRQAWQDVATNVILRKALSAPYQ